MWIKADQPDKALSSIKSALKASNKSETIKPHASLFYVNLLLYLEKIDDAKAEIEKIKPALQNSQRFGTMLSALQAEILRRESNHKEALELTLSTISSLEKLPGATLFRTSNSAATNWQKKVIENKKSEAPDPSIMNA